MGKLSKQAIFSLHRGAIEEAQTRLDSAEKAAQELLPIIQSNPTLRSGSFSNAIEEVQSAKVFCIDLPASGFAKLWNSCKIPYQLLVYCK